MEFYGTVVKNLSANAGDTRATSSIPGSERYPKCRKRQSIPLFLPGKFYGERSLVGYSPWGRKELDTAAWWSTQT